MKFPSLPSLQASDLIFSAKCFAAAMLAVYLASWAGQPRPFWALLTTYVVAAPLAGMVRSKAVYRLVGTFVGSAAAVLIVPNFDNSPELLSLVMALWVALCLYLSLHDRTPRSYAFMLSGYTAALIGFPVVSNPGTVFNNASARVEEIALGILSAAVVHSLILPSDLRQTILGLLDRCHGDIRQWAGDILNLRRSDQTSGADRSRVAADMTQLRILGIHIPYDTSHLSWTADNIAAMQDAIAALTPSLSAAEDRLQAIEQAEGDLPQDITAVLDRIRPWLEQSGCDDDPAILEDLHRSIAGIAAVEVPAWNRALRIGLSIRLGEFVDGWQSCLRLRNEIDQGLEGAPRPARPARSQGEILHLDQGMALLSAFAALVAILLCCAFWILTGWSMGYMAAMFAAIFCSFFASMDDPVPAIHSFMKWTLWSVPVSAVYVLVLLPLVTDFTSLVVVCIPGLFGIGLFAARPSMAPKAIPVIIGLCGTLAMHDTSQADLVSFVNLMLGEIAGIVVASRITRLMRSVGTAWSARRIQRATWQDLNDLARQPSLPDNGEAYLIRMLDRIALLAPRVVQLGGRVPGVPAEEALRDLRLGADIVTLQKHRPILPRRGLQNLLDHLADWYQRRGEGHLVSPPAALCELIDNVLEQELGVSAPRRHAVIAALVGLRRNLFPQATPALNQEPEGTCA